MRQLKYTCLPECHNTLIDMPGINQWEPSITCPTCGRKAFFMTIVVLSIPTPEPDVDTDPTLPLPNRWKMTKAGDA